MSDTTALTGPGTAAHPLAVPEDLRREIEAFLYLEARLADESRYDEWEALLTDDMHYWVPKGPADHDPSTRIAYINDNRSRIIEVLEADDRAGEYRVAANFVLYEVVAQTTGDVRIWPGRATWRLRRVAGHLRMAQKIVELVTSQLPQPNLAFIL
jgi:3-phenylpropionate/cinnamic acid dioxygenase small subunit